MSAALNTMPSSSGSFKSGEPRKRKKNRRGKPKRRRYHPDREGAPDNTTQFLMEQHKSYRLDSPLSPEEVVSVTSVESEEDYWHYFSPRNREFQSKEFSNTYDHVNAERLSSMSKADLIQEYIQMEDRVDEMEKQLRMVRAQQHNQEGTDSEDEVGRGEMRMDPDMAEKIRIFQEEIRRLMEENERLRKEEHERLRKEEQVQRLQLNCCRTITPSVSSVDSESDSTSSATTASQCTSSCCHSSTCEDKSPQSPVPIVSDSEHPPNRLGVTTPCHFTLFTVEEEGLVTSSRADGVSDLKSSGLMSTIDGTQL